MRVWCVRGVCAWCVCVVCVQGRLTVEAVDAQEDLLAVEAALQVDDLVFDKRRLEAGLEARRVDADREGVHSDGAARGVVEDPFVALPEGDRWAP